MFVYKHKSNDDAKKEWEWNIMKKEKKKPIEHLKRHSKRNIHKHKSWKIMMCWKQIKNKKCKTLLDALYEKLYIEKKWQKEKAKRKKKIMIFLCRKHDQSILLSILPISKLTWPPKKMIWWKMIYKSCFQKLDNTI